MNSQLSIPCLFGPNQKEGANLTKEIQEIEQVRRRCRVALGNRLKRAKELIRANFVRLGKSDKTAQKAYLEWALINVGYKRTTVYKMEKAAEAWQGVPEEVVAKFTIGALDEASRDSFPAAAKELAIEQATRGEVVTKNNVLEFKKRTEPKNLTLMEVLDPFMDDDEEAGLRKTLNKSKAEQSAENLELIGMELSAAEERTELLEDFIARVLADRHNNIQQSYLDEAIHLGLEDELRLIAMKANAEAMKERQYAATA